MTEAYAIVFLIGMIFCAATALYALAAPLVVPDSRPQCTVRSIALALAIGGLVSCAIWPYANVALELLGWTLLWGDNSHPLQTLVVPLTTAVSVVPAMVAAGRIVLGSAAAGYARQLAALSVVPILVLLALWSAKNGAWMQIATLSPVPLAVALWIVLVRRQLQQRKVSVASLVGLMTLISAGLTLTVFLRS